MRANGLLAWIVVIAASTWITTPRTAGAYCLEGPLTTTGGTVLHEIPVYLKASPSDTTFLGRPIGEIEQAIRAVLNTWWEEGNSEFRLIYAGKTTSTTTTGRILIRSDPSTSCTRCTGTDDAPACEVTSPSNTQRYGSTIWFEAPTACTYDGVPWSTIPLATSSGFRHILLHEIGHALGIDHPHNSTTCAGGGVPDTNLRGVVMAVNHGLSILPDDRNGLVYMYGEKCRQLDRWSTTTAVNTWTYGVRRNVCTQVRPQGAGNLASGKVRLGFKNASFVSVYNDTFSGYSFAYPSAFAASVHPIAVAGGSTDSELLVSWADYYESETVFDGCSYISVAVSHDGGSSWSLVVDSANQEYCTDGGPSAAYDPTTGIYAVFLSGGRPSAGPQFITLDQNGNVLYESQTFGEHVYAVHTPAIDCATVLSGNPCMMAYGRNDPYGCLATRSFSIDPSSGEITYGSEVVQCYPQEHSPALRFTTTTAANPWVLVYKEVDTLWSLVKPQGAGSWTNLRQLLNDPTNGVASAALGLGYNGLTYTVYGYAGVAP